MISKREYNLIKDQLEVSMKIKLITEQGDSYRGIIRELVGKTVVFTSENGAYIEMRWGLGTVEDENQPYAAIGVDGSGRIETTEEYSIDINEDITYHREKGTIEYDYNVDSIQIIDEDPSITIG